MFAKQVLTDEERRVDPQLGYPRGYAKLCRNAHIQMRGLITPYTEGPPQRFLPYILQPEDIAKMKEFNELFPITESEERDPSSARRYADSLWKQLDHLRNAGFDPAKFRIDPYGNVLYINADPASPLAWEVDHWFPHSRGGKTVPSNLRLVQWQVNQRKQNKLEFLVPWWDLQLGVSVNQFLSIFASKNSDFRQRAFSLFFFAGENEPLNEVLVADSHSWPSSFRERKSQFGLAPAAIVTVQKQADDSLKLLNGNRPINSAWPVPSGTPSRKRWTVEEEEALRRAIHKFGPGNWKEIKEHEPVFRNRSTVQIKDKYRQMKGDWELEKENRADDLSDKELILSRTVQKENRLKKIREQEIQAKEEEIVQLDKDLKELQEQNEAERLALEDLESILIKHRRRVEKQRRWSETQSSYRMCLEKMIRDAMHQSIVYKEQGRLNQAACNALMARLETQKATCDASEMELIKKIKQREDLELLLRPCMEQAKKSLHDDNSSCSKQNIKMELEELPTCYPRDTGCAHFAHVAEADVKEEPDTVVKHKESFLPLLESREEYSTELQKDLKLFSKEEKAESKANMCLIAPKEQCRAEVEIVQNEPALSVANMGRKVAVTEKSRLSEAEESDLDVLIVGYEYEGAKARAREAESVGENLTSGTLSDFKQTKFEGWAKEDCASMVGENNGLTKQSTVAKEDPACKPLEDDQLDKMFGDELAMQGQAEAVMADKITGEENTDDDERIKTAGQSNLDKWLHSQAGEDTEPKNNILPATHDDFIPTQVDESNKLGFRSPHHKKIPSFGGSDEKTDIRHRNARHATESVLTLEADCLELVEKFHSLHLACNVEGHEEMQTKVDGISRTLNTDTEVSKKGSELAIKENPCKEMENENQAMTTPLAVGNVDGMFEHGIKKILHQREELNNFDRVKVQQTVGRIPTKGDSYYMPELKESEGIISGDKSMNMNLSGQGGVTEGIVIRNSVRDCLQQKEKECRLQRIESAGVCSNANNATASFSGVRRTGGESKGRNMVYGEVVQSGENGELEETKRTGDEDGHSHGHQGVMLLKNGLNASIKTCTHVWRKAIKRLEGATIGTDHNRNV